MLEAFLNGGKDLPFWALAISAIILHIALTISTRLMQHRHMLRLNLRETNRDRFIHRVNLEFLLQIA